MLFSKEAPAIVYAAPGTKTIVLGAVLAFAAACFYLLGVLVERLFAPVAEDVTGVHLLSGNLSAIALVTLAVGMLSIAVGVVWLLRLPEPERLKVRIRSGIFDSRYGNPLHLREGEVLPHVTCEETGEGRFELAVSTSSSTAEEIAKLAPSISSRLCGRFSRYAVVLSEADEACNRVTFHIEDVTVHREIVADSVSELQPPSAYKLRVQDGTSIDLRTSGSMLVAGKTRSGKTTGIISLVLQALLAGPDSYGSRVLVVDPKRAELSRLPHVATLDEDGNAVASSPRWARSPRPSRSVSASSTSFRPRRGMPFTGGTRASMSRSSSSMSTWPFGPSSQRGRARRTRTTASRPSTA